MIYDAVKNRSGPRIAAQISSVKMAIYEILREFQNRNWLRQAAQIYSVKLTGFCAIWNKKSPKIAAQFSASFLKTLRKLQSMNAHWRKYRNYPKSLKMTPIQLRVLMTLFPRIMKKLMISPQLPIIDGLLLSAKMGLYCNLK